MKLLIKPYLDKKKISIVQIGHAESEQIPGVFDLRGRMTSTQQAYVLKNSLLHCGTNDFLLDVASHFDVPVVGMYGNTFADVAKPYWGNESKKVILESHRNGRKPSFLAEENPRTINLINPEDIAYGILELLDIKVANKNITKFIGNKVSIVVENKPISFTVPEIPFVSIQSPVSNGLKIRSITPAATLDKVPWSASPIANPAAPRTAIIEVVSIPNWLRAIINVNVKPAYLKTAAITGIKVASEFGTLDIKFFANLELFPEIQKPINIVPIPANILIM